MGINVRYETRYFGFVDILGFSNLIRQSKAGSVEVKAVHNLLKVVHKPAPKRKGQSSDLRAQSISDAVTISARAHNLGLLEMLAD